jgi:bleomycin hydrolase
MKNPAAKINSAAPATPITPALTASMERDFQANPQFKLLENAVTAVSAQNLVTRRDVVVSTDNSFSIHLDDWAVTNQKSSGRCWLFAGLNLLRVGAMKKMNLKNFEFSQNYPLFWDKLEKANYFLEAIIETAGLDIDDRTVNHLLSYPLSDGGQWNMFADLVEKYGLVPKAAMPETESSSNTGVMNGVLVSKLREGAKTLRDLRAKGAGAGELKSAKENILSVFYRILCIHLGHPPAKFDWQWKDSKNKFLRDENMTPPAFAKKYLAVPVKEYVCLVHDPRPGSPYGRTYTVKYLGNVVGAGIVLYLNVEVEFIKETALRMLKAGEPVWFGCDVGKQMDRAAGLWDASLHDFENFYGTTFGLDKSARLLYGASRMSHAMLFTGVDIMKGKPRRWRVENSWGDAAGQKGFFTMNDSWFEQYTFEIAARMKYLPAKYKAALKLEPIVLPPWDPMGSLAY